MDLIPVKKSTLATWCREVRLTDEQYAAIKERQYGSRLGIPVDTQQKRRAEIEMIKAQASLEAIHLQDDPFWAMGVALYWAEGSKTNRRLEMAHSEPEALRLMMDWIRRFHDTTATFAAAINLHLDNDGWPGTSGRRNSESISRISPRPSSSQMAQVIARIILPMGFAEF
jgi:hypothetical protein